MTMLASSHPEEVYLDCAATCPVEPRVFRIMERLLLEDFGNSGSRTHTYGLKARQAVEHARDQVARVVAARRGEVIFTSGATESNNLALLGLAAYGRATGRMHVVTTAIEHVAVLEPLEALEQQGFEITYVKPGPSGRVRAEDVCSAVRDATLMVSLMYVNNETGAVQPVEQIADGLNGSPVFFHVDAAQGFGQILEPLRHPRIDLISASAHKLMGPKGVGALITRRREGLRPLMHGGGQERGLRPGTLPSHLIAGFGEAAELAIQENAERCRFGEAFKRELLAGLAPLAPVHNGDPEHQSPFLINLSFPGSDAESVMQAWRGLAAVSDGAACTSQKMTCSHVLAAMGITGSRAEGAIRLSWCPLTPRPDWRAMVAALEQVGSAATSGRNQPA